MPLFALFSVLFLTLTAMAHAEPECEDLPFSWDGEEIVNLANNGLCALQKTKTTDEAKVKKLAEDEEKNGGKVKKIFTEPTSRSSSSITYRFPEITLNPGEALYFGVPTDISQRAVRFAILGHRQDPATEKGWDPQKKWDDIPGLSSLQFHDAKINDNSAWRYWGGDASGSKGAKFAEVRYEVEMENLYEWRKNGHAGVNTNDSTTAPLQVDAIRVVSIGKDPVKVSEVTLKVLPPKADFYTTATFSSGTEIGDPETGSGQKLGGGQAHKGKFPGALVLPASNTSSNLPNGWRIEGGKLIIPAPKGKILTSVETAIGDTHPDEVKNKDGGWGTPGWSKLSINYRKKNGTVDTLMRRENVPPEGVLMSTPEDGCYVAQEGDEIVIDASSDMAYIMGLRLGWRDKSP